MDEKLIQIRIDGDIKDEADRAFKEVGLSSQSAIKIFLTRVAKTGETPFDNLFNGNN